MAKKKWKKRLKKIAKAALIGGALYAGAKALKGRKTAAADVDSGRGSGLRDTVGSTKWISKKSKDVLPESKPVVTSPVVHGGGGIHHGKPKTLHLEKMARAHLPKGPPGWDNPYTTPRVHVKRGQKDGGRIGAKTGGRIRKQFGGALPVGGTARRDMRSGYYPSDMGMRGGPMYKKGGRVTGIAKRGFGRALMKGKK